MLRVSVSQTDLITQGQEIVEKRQKSKADKSYLAFVVFQLRMRHFKNTVQIADALGMRLHEVQRLISEHLTDIITTTRMDATQDIELQIQQLEAMLSDAWDMWKRSCGTTTTVTARASVLQNTLDDIESSLNDMSPEDLEGEVQDRATVTRTVRSRGGDPRFLGEMRSILQDLRKLKGIHDPPKQHVHYGQFEVSGEIANGTPQVSQMDQIIALLVQQNVLPDVIEGTFRQDVPLLESTNEDDLEDDD